MNAETARPRCHWASTIPEFGPYHDNEWGYPVTDDVRLFEKMSLESFQSGLSWRTILNKRDAFRRAFGGFVPGHVAQYGADDVARLLADASIVRHRGKIESVINNAAVVQSIQDSHGSLAAFAWQFEPAPSTRPERITEETLGTMTTCPESVALAKALKKLGWRFFGPTTAYAFMQAMGLVNDHTEECWCRPLALKAQQQLVLPT